MNHGATFFVVAFAAAAAAQEPASTEASPTPPTTTPAATTTAPDTRPPQVLDLSIASDNPLSAPVITLMIKDDVGVANVVCHWRVGAGAWQDTPMNGGSGQLFIAVLPDGTQETGFSLWVEAHDAANNFAHVASDVTPLVVAAAVEGNAERVERQELEAQKVNGPHPAWVMLALGTGIATGAAAGVFVYDLSLIGKRQEIVDGLLAQDISAARRAELEDTKVGLDEAVLQDGALVGTLGVISAAALTTGVVLLTVAALEE